MVGIKENIFSISILKDIVTKVLVITFFVLFIVFGCKEKQEIDLSFTLMPRDSYYTNFKQGIEIYRLNDSKKLMDGYYVIGNKSTKWEEFNVKKGVLNGDYIVFHPNGKKLSESKYINGVKHGEERVYYPSEKLKRIKQYKNNAPYGKSISYFESGQIQTEAIIKEEETIESVTYNIIGQIESQMFIKDGRKISQNIKNGIKITESISSTYDDFEAMKFYDEKGKLKMFLRIFKERDKTYLIELDNNEEEIKRIDIEDKSKEAKRYINYLYYM